jgi:hypothetical protein
MVVCHVSNGVFAINIITIVVVFLNCLHEIIMAIIWELSFCESLTDTLRNPAIEALEGINFIE